MSHIITLRLKCADCPHRITVEVEGPSFFTDGERCIRGIAVIAGWEVGEGKAVRCTVHRRQTT